MIEISDQSNQFISNISYQSWYLINYNDIGH